MSKVSKSHLRWCSCILLLAAVVSSTSTLQTAMGQDTPGLPALISSPTGLSPASPSCTSTGPMGGCDEGCIPPMTTLSSIAEGFATHGERCFMSKGGANYPDRAMWSPINVKLVNPREYLRINSLDNDDPNSFAYTMRPNLFNIPVEDEWDWYNLINTDRPDFTDTPFSVGEGIVYLESGLTNTRASTPDNHLTLRSVPETLFRVGITNEFELRFKWLGYQMLNAENPTTGATASSFGGGDFDIGFKWVMFQQKNWFPMTTLVTGALLPTGTNGFSGNAVQPHFNIVNGWGIRRYIYLKHQIGMDNLTQPEFSVVGPIANAGPLLTASRPTVNSWHSSVSCLFQATKRIGGFVEWFAIYGQDQRPTNFTDMGIFFYLTPTIQFDCVFGTSIAAPDSETLFTKAGFSTRW